MIIDKKSFWIVISLVALVIIVGLYIVANPTEDVGVLNVASDAVPSTTLPGSKSTTGSTERMLLADTFTMHNIEYSLEWFAVLNERGADQYTDGRLVSRAAGKRSVVVPSISKALPSLDKMILKKFFVRETPERIVFVSVPSDSTASYGNLYQFTLATKTFTRLFISRFLPYTISIASNPEWFSSDTSKFLSIHDRAIAGQSETRYLYIVDLDTDQARAIAEVKSAEESFTQSIGSGNIPNGVYRWLRPNLIEYSVFNIQHPMPRIATQVRTVEVNTDQK